jgi:uncharacterized protein (DUF2062 family)
MRLRLKQRWKKCIIYFIKLFRQEGSPECIARGAALGLLAALLIPIGLHTVTILLLAFIFRCNKITAFGVTFAFSNEFTIPIIYPLQCMLGGYILCDPLTLAEVKTVLSNLYNNVSMDELVNAGRELGIPYLIGGAILSALAMPPGYIIALRFARKMKAGHAEKMQKRLDASIAAKKLKTPNDPS